MYDTINLWVERESVSNTQLLTDPSSLIPDITSHYKDSGDVYFTGNIGNYKACVSNRGLSLKGSLAKYYLGDNLQTLGLGDTKYSIQKLSDTLHMPIEQAKVTRIDIAQNLIVKHDPRVFYSYLGESSRYQRLIQPHSLYYQNNIRTLVFYDKVIEFKRGGELVPEIYKNRNTLRYELRFLKGLTKEFNCSGITGSTLSNEAFYINLLDRWKEEYFKIQKHKQPIFNPIAMNNIKEFINQLILSGIEKYGGQAEILKMIDQAKKEGLFNNRMQHKRLKDKMEEITSNPILTMESEAIKELDKKIKEAVKFYR